MGGKSDYNGWAWLQLGYFYAQRVVVIPATAKSGATEPAWPTWVGGTVVDGGVTWTAIQARRIRGSVSYLLNRETFQHNLGAYPSHYFQYGTLTWITGENAGFGCDIRDSMASVAGAPPYIMTLEIMPRPIQQGDIFEAVVGCAKIRNKCQQFNNMDNFRGFPDMPTEERALQTPNITQQGYTPKSTK